MNKLVKVIAPLASVAVMLANAGEEKPLFTGSANVDVQSRYMYRGLAFSEKDAPVAGHTLALTKTFDNGIAITPSYFGNYNFKNEKYDETDALLSVAKTFGNFSLNLGSGFYHSPSKAWNDTAEITGGVIYNEPKTKLAISANGGVDIMDSKGGSFLELTAARSFGLDKTLTFMPKGSTLDLAVVQGFNFEYFKDDNGAAYTVPQISLNIPLTKKLSVKPYIKHQISNRNDFESLTFGGLSATYSF